MSNHPLIESLPWREPCEVFAEYAPRPHCVWLDTVVGNGLSILAAEPVQVFCSKGRQCRLIGAGGETRLDADPFDALKEHLESGRSRFEGSAAAEPFPVGAAIGYFGYDLKSFVEKLPANAVDDLGLPDCWFGFYDRLLVFDHAPRRMWRVTAVRRRSPDLAASPDRQVSSPSPGDLRSGTCAGLGSRVCETPPPCAANPRTTGFSPNPSSGGQPGGLPLPQLSSNFTRDAYCRTVLRAKEYIAAGDIYQVNLSQRFQCDVGASPVDVYLALRESNPAPYGAYLDIGDAQVLSSSPECFLNIHDRQVVTRPIKGTRPRGKSPAEDERIAAELLASPKDNAELVMITDLERNDLGRVCEFGSVTVRELNRVESFATVHHLVATVEGQLRSDVSHVDCVRACFPGGSITGAPKIRAMEIIDELEPQARGVYTGAIGFFGFNNVSHFNIAIRTAVYQPLAAETADGAVGHRALPTASTTTTVGRAGSARRPAIRGRLTFHAGGGIVADSEPEAEYDETLAKAQGIFNAIDQLRLR